MFVQSHQVVTHPPSLSLSPSSTSWISLPVGVSNGVLIAVYRWRVESTHERESRQARVRWYFQTKRQT